MNFGSCVILVAKEDKNKILVVTRPYNTDLLFFPGGRKELDETVLNCAVREVFEETGVVLNEKELIPILNDWCISENIKYLVFSFYIEISINEVFTQKEDKIIPQWVSWEHFLNCAEFHNYSEKVNQVIKKKNV